MLKFIRCEEAIIDNVYQMLVRAVHTCYELLDGLSLEYLLEEIDLEYRVPVLSEEYVGADRPRVNVSGSSSDP